MKREDILRAVGDLSDDLVSAAAPGAPRKGNRRPRWAAAAACACLIAAGGLALSLRGAPAIPGPVDPVEPEKSAAIFNPPTAGGEVPTSDTYADLPALLTYLGRHDDHSSRDSKEGGSSGDAVRSAAGYTAVVKDGYAYHLAHEDGSGALRISRLGEQAELLDSLELDADLLFLWGDRLAAVGHSAPSVALDDPSLAWVWLYSLSDPARPVLEREFSLLGGLSACWLDGGSLYLITEDGVCACGYSRLSDPAGYLPQLTQNGQVLPWGEEETAILGEPTQVHYAAAVRIDLASGELAGKRAFYGDIESIFHGEGWLALVTGGCTRDTLLRPQVYSFSRELVCDGRLDTAALLGLSRSETIKDGSLPEGRYPDIVSVSREGDVLRAVGYVTRRAGGANSASLLAAALDLTAGTLSYDLLEAERFYHIGDLQWEGDRALLWVTSLSRELEKTDALCFARFNGAQASLVSTGLTCDSVDGVDMMYAYGSPLSWLETVVPLGEGRYLRYNGVPDGLDLYDLSGDVPALVRRSAVSLESGGRFEFQWTVYDPNTVGLLAVWPNANGEYRNVSYTWDVYDVKGDSLMLLSRTPVRAGELTNLEYGGQRWLAGWDGALYTILQ